MIEDEDILLEELGEAEFEPVVETKNLHTERVDGRIMTFVDPKGTEYHVRKGRAQRFRKNMGVDSTWIVK